MGRSDSLGHQIGWVKNQLAFSASAYLITTKADKTNPMIVTALIFVFSGILVKNFKMYNLLAGYNTMPKEEKDKYNIEVIATAVRNIMFGMALVTIAGYAIGSWTENEKLE